MSAPPFYTPVEVSKRPSRQGRNKTNPRDTGKRRGAVGPLKASRREDWIIQKIEGAWTLQEPQKVRSAKERPSRFYVAGKVHFQTYREESYEGECIIDPDVFEMMDSAPQGLARSDGWEPSFDDRVLPKHLTAAPSGEPVPIDSTLDALRRRFTQ